MPELPEVETLANELREKISGRVLSKIILKEKLILKTPREVIEKKLPGKKLVGIARRGKFLRFDFDGALAFWIHLGMTGQLLWLKEQDFKNDLHVHAILFFEDIPEPLVFRDIRKFGSFCLTNGSSSSLPEGIRLLGPEPSEIKNEAFANLFRHRKGRIKSLLLNQKLLAGLGNIYADESLFRAGIDPRRRPYRLSRQKLIALHRAICDTLQEAIRQGGSSIDDYLHADGSRGSFQNFHRVYGRAGEPCSVCQAPLRQIRLAARSACFCPTCQK